MVKASWLARGSTIVLASVALAACGGEDERGKPQEPPGGGADEPGKPQGPPGGGASKAAAERLCQAYRTAVTDIRSSGLPRDQAADFRAAARAARAARRKARGLGSGGADYTRLLDVVARAYNVAASARERGDSEGFSRALDTGEPADEALDTAADRAGLSACSLDEPHPGQESRVSQSGFPALLVPKGPRVPPDRNNRRQAYPLDPRGEEAIVLERGPRLATGRIPAAEAAKRFTDSGPSAQSLRPAGSAGDQQVPMRRFRYDDPRGRGSIDVFSGQGHIWILACSSRRPSGPSPTLRRACDRAATGAGFLMF